MTSIATFASMPSDLDSKLEKLNLKLIQKSLNRTKTNSCQFLLNSTQTNVTTNASKIKSYSISGDFAVKKPIILTTNRQNSQTKKMVRFADALGFELVNVKILSNSFLNENQFTQFNSEDDDSDEFNSDSNDYNTSCDEVENFNAKPVDTQIISNLTTNNDTVNHADPNSFIYDNLNFTWQCLFDQPGIMPNFYSKLNQNKVLLEGIYSNHFKLNGFVRVINLSFNKRVFVRYTLNNWKSFNDAECNFLLNGTNDNKQTDRFKFTIVLDKNGLVNTIDENLRSSSRNSSSPVLKLEFAICYELKSNDQINSSSEESHWDNNNSKNYQYNCFFKILNPKKI